MGYFIIFIFFAAAIILAERYYMLKKQLKSVLGQLGQEQTKLVTVALADYDIERIVLEINKLLEQIQQVIMKSNACTATLKSSIADISHDMKTPLTSVIGYLQLAEKECTDKNIEEILKICLERTRYCNALINDFFELSVIESQGCNPKIESVDAAGIVCEQILANYPVFEEKNITPHFEDLDKKIIIFADFNMFNRVIQNLISNSIKYTSGDIFFRVFEENTKVIITVSNPVRASVDIAHIFDRFYTQDRQGSSGSGIGLYICKQFVEAMGGSISANIDRNCLSVKVTMSL